MYKRHLFVYCLFTYFLSFSFILSAQTGNSGIDHSGIAFSFKTNAPIRSTPAISGGVLYVGGDDGNLYSIDASTGKKNWQFETKGPVVSSPLVDRGLVYFASRDNYLYAVHANNGSLAWRYHFGNDLGEQNYWDYFLSSAAIEGNLLYIGSGDGFFYALDKITGKVSWKFNAGTRIRTTPALAAGKVVFGTMDGYLVALHLKDGKLAWKFASDGVGNKFMEQNRDRTSLLSSPVISDGTVAIGGHDDILYAVDLETGKEKWRVNHFGSWMIATAIKDGIVYGAGGVAAFVEAIDLKTGKSLWKFKAKSAVWSSFSFDGPNIYMSDITGNIYGLDAKTGIKKWLFPMGQRTFSTPVISKGLLYCSSDQGTLYAVHCNSGDTSFLHSKKIVYWEGKRSDSAFGSFLFNVDQWTRDYLRRQDYELMNATQLKTFMALQLDQHNPSVIVFTDSKIPESLYDGLENSLLRKYLNAGGKIVFLAVNPVFLNLDPLSGVLINFNLKRASQVFGMSFPTMSDGSGLYYAPYTHDGGRWGLNGYTVGYWPINTSEVTTVLAKDEFGHATAWVKNYGGKEGTGLLQLAVMQQGVLGSDFFPMRMAIEYGINW